VDAKGETLKVQFLDLSRQCVGDLGARVREAINRVLASGCFVLGREVAAFEDEWAKYTGAKYCVSCASGTDALTMLARCVPVEDPALVPALTSPATAMAMLNAGRPVRLVDVNAGGQADVSGMWGEWSGSEVSVVVDLWGVPRETAVYGDFCDPSRLILDRCQTHGIRIHPPCLGAAYSFYPTKNLGALGDGGAVVTDNADVATHCRRLRQYGWDDRRVSLHQGWNSRLDELHAAVLRAKLPFLAEHNRARVRIIDAYRLANWGLEFLSLHGNGHLCVVRIPDGQRSAFRLHMATRGIETAIHYDTALNKMPAFGEQPECPIAERLSREVVSLPCNPWLREDEVAAVCEALAEWKG
jgi:dTDP-4-amino-4,6-dideoxygalactose transaminase